MRRHVWHPVREGRLLQEEADALTGQDLWLALHVLLDGSKIVLSGFHLEGNNDGWYLNDGRSTASMYDVTHFMIRDPKPPFPTSESLSPNGLPKVLPEGSKTYSGFDLEGWELLDTGTYWDGGILENTVLVSAIDWSTVSV